MLRNPLPSLGEDTTTQSLASQPVDLPEYAEPGPDDSLIADVLKAPFKGIANAGINTAELAYDFADYITGDNLPDWDPELYKSDTFAGSMVQGVSNFLTGFIPVFGQLGKVGALAKGAGVLRGAVAGAITDFTVFDAQEGNLSTLIQSNPSLANPITELLSTSEEDTEAVGRLKNVVEGLGLGALTDGLVAGVRGIRRARAAKAAGADPTEVTSKLLEPFEGVESIEDALPKPKPKSSLLNDEPLYLTDINDGSLDDSANSRGSTKSKSEIEREFRNDLKTYDQLSDFEKSIKTEFGEFIRFSNSDGRALGGRLFGLMAKSSGYDYGIPTIRTEIIVANGLSEAMTLRVIGHEMIHRKLAHLDEKTADKVLSAVKELVNEKELIASVRANWKIDGKNTNFGPVMEEILAEHGSRIFGSKFHKAATSGKVSITDTAMSIFKDLLRLIQFSLNGENKKGVDAIAKDLFELSDKAIAGKYKDQKISIFSSNQNRKANESNRPS